MKKSTKLAALTMAALMAASLAACSGGGAGSNGGGAANATDAPKQFAVGMVTDVGGVQDQSFNQSAWEGLEKLSADHPDAIAVSYLESLQEANFGPNLDKMADAKVKNDIIWGIGFMMADAIMNAAQTNPNQSYAIVDNAWGDTPSNLTGVVFRAQEPSFLVGYIAANTTKTGKVGFVGGIKGEVIDQFEFGYRAGVAYAAKELGKSVEVDVQYADSFSDDATGKAIALRMYSDGADIVFHAAGGAGIGVINAAKETGKYAVGVDRDQSYLAPDNVITSALKLVGQAMYDVSLRKYNGENIGGQTLAYGVAEGACGIPPYEGSTAKLVSKAAYDGAMAARDKIVDGSITVPYNRATLDSFTAGL